MFTTIFSKVAQVECRDWLEFLWLNQCARVISKGGNYLRFKVIQI